MFYHQQKAHFLIPALSHINAHKYSTETYSHTPILNECLTLSIILSFFLLLCCVKSSFHLLLLKSDFLKLFNVPLFISDEITFFLLWQTGFSYIKNPKGK